MCSCRAGTTGSPALCSSLLRSRPAIGVGAPWPVALALFTVAALVGTTGVALYVSWTPLGQSDDQRNARPLLPARRSTPRRAIPQYRGGLEQPLAFAWWPVLLFPLVTLAVTPAVIMERYYGSLGVMLGSAKVLLLQ